MEQFAEWGYIGMFTGSFLAATIIPLGSEVILVALLLAGLDPLGLAITATLGNTLGGATSFGLGYLGKWSWLECWFGLTTDQLNRAKSWIDRFGIWSALLTWLPAVGDPMAIGLGFFRTSVWKTFVLMFLGKGLRYVVLIYFFL